MRAAAALGAALAALTLAGCAQLTELGLVPPGAPGQSAPRPVLRPQRDPSPVFGARLIADRRVDGVQVDVLVVGHGRVRGNMLSELKSPEARLKPPILAFLIRHPRQGPVLFGAGLPEDLGGLGAKRVRGAALSPFTRSKGRDLVSQLLRLGVQPGDVKTVVLPALAPEWVGRAGSFPNATVVISSEAWYSGRKRPLEAGIPDLHAFVPEERLKLIDFSGTPHYGPFAHAVDLFKDGTVILVDLDGGAAGGIGMWVNTDSGPVLLTGPAAFVYDNVYDDALPDRRFVVDVSSFAWNARAMRLAAQAVPRLVIVPAHDLSTLKIAPRPDVILEP